MAQGYPKGRSVKKYDFLGGGLVTRPDDRYVNLLNDKGHFYSPDLTNVQFTKIGSIQKPFGYAQVGSDVQSAVYYTNAGTGASATSQIVTDNQTQATCFKLTSPSTSNLIYLNIGLRFNLSAGVSSSLLRNIRCVIKSDAAGNPGTTIATSNAYTDALETASVLITDVSFYFPSNVALTNGTDYWFCFQGEAKTGAAAAGLFISYYGDTISGTTKVTSDSYATFSSPQTFKPRITVYTSAKPVLGIYDYRPQAAGVVTQFPMIACAGTLYYWTGAAYTSIATGLASSANSLYDFSTLKNLLFSCDYATSNNQAWDGAAAATMTHGYRPTMSAMAQSAGAGPLWDRAGLVKVMLVTQLRSGGYRCSSVTPATTSNQITLGARGNKIDLSGIAVNSIATQFSFDIAALATTIYCTVPGGSIYYKIPAAYLSGAINPITNVTAGTNSILPMTDAQLIAGGSFESNLGYPQGYGTGQVDTPKAKYMEVFQNMLATAGDPNNPSRVWFSEQFAPQVWGNGDSGTGIQGDYLDIAVDDGEQVTGLAVSDGALLVGKQSSIYRVDYTGNASDTWVVRKVHGQLGVLSNWSMQIIPDGLFFLSNRGPAICYGTYSDVLPQTRLIQNLFDNTSAESFNLTSMIYTVACNDTTRNQVLMTISSPSVSVRDRILTYDYEQKMFGLYDGYQANYIAIIGDSNGFPVLWNGNLSGQVFKRSSAYSYAVTPVNLIYNTPAVDFGDPASWAQVDFLHIAGAVQTTGTLYIDFFKPGSTTDYYRTVAIDMTSPNFSKGMAVRVGTVASGLKYRLRNPYSGSSGCEIHWIRLEFSESSGTRMG